MEKHLDTMFKMMTISSYRSADCIFDGLEELPVFMREPPPLDSKYSRTPNDCKSSAK